MCYRIQVLSPLILTACVVGPCPFSCIFLTGMGQFTQQALLTELCKIRTSFSVVSVFQMVKPFSWTRVVQFLPLECPNEVIKAEVHDFGNDSVVTFSFQFSWHSQN